MKKCPKCLQSYSENVEVCDCGFAFTEVKKPLIPTTIKNKIVQFLIEVALLSLISIFFLRIIVQNILELDNDAASIYLVMYSIPFIIINIFNLNDKVVFITMLIPSFIFLNIFYILNLFVMGMTYLDLFDIIFIICPALGINIFFVSIFIFFLKQKTR